MISALRYICWITAPTCYLANTDALNVEAFICSDISSPNLWWKLSHVCFPVKLAPLYDTICPSPSETHLLCTAPYHTDPTPPVDPICPDSSRGLFISLVLGCREDQQQHAYGVEAVPRIKNLPKTNSERQIQYVWCQVLNRCLFEIKWKK